jgi:glyoxylase-like metal-dependent hydrolase (beta-lactamase superfamily II)
VIDAFHVLDTGYCTASEHLMVRGGARRPVECHALVALLHHGREGWLLFDAGYSPRLAEATAGLPYSLYGRMLPAHTSAEQAVVGQLARFGLQATDVRHVIASHFHPDHACGLRDFPAARFVCDRGAYADVARRSGWAALRAGFLPGLIPPDFADRARFVDAYEDSPDMPSVGRAHDLFGDGSLLLVPLPGHARGQVGLFVPETPHGPVFLVADGAYLTRSLRDDVPPHPVTNLFADDGRAVRATVSRLHAFHRARPDVALIPTHCPEAYARWVTAGGTAA